LIYFEPLIFSDADLWKHQTFNNSNLLLVTES